VGTKKGCGWSMLWFCMSIKKLSRSNWELTVCRVWTFSLGAQEYQPRRDNIWPHRTQILLIFSKITCHPYLYQEGFYHGRITVTEQNRSVLTIQTCVSAVFWHLHTQISFIWDHIVSHNSTALTSFVLLLTAQPVVNPYVIRGWITSDVRWQIQMQSNKLRNLTKC
jgi:hypothetical protein